MKNLRGLDAYRDCSIEVIKRFGNVGDETCGTFLVASPIDNATIRIIASSHRGWDHVSVSRKNRCPNWPEMEFIKRLFFKDDECAMQLHFPIKDHISVHDYCLHIWLPLDAKIPIPPKDMVA